MENGWLLDLLPTLQLLRGVQPSSLHLLRRLVLQGVMAVQISALCAVILQGWRVSRVPRNVFFLSVKTSEAVLIGTDIGHSISP